MRKSARSKSPYNCAEASGHKPYPGCSGFREGRFKIVNQGKHVVMSDGSEEDFGPGDVIDIPPGHDAWVVGGEPAVSLDVTGSTIWAKPS